MSAGYGGFSQFAIGLGRDTLVECHYNVGANVDLGLGGDFWCELMERTVYVRLELHASIGDFESLG